VRSIRLISGAPATTAGGIFGSTSAPAFGAPAPAPLFVRTPSPAPGLFGAWPSSQIGAGGSRIVPFQPTPSTDGPSSFFFQCITSQSQYETKSFEELRFEDYSQGNRGDGSRTQQSAGGFGVGAFGSTAPAMGFGGFGSPAPAPMGFGGSSAGAPTAFGAAAPAPFGASAPVLGAPVPSAFGAAPAPAVGAPSPAFGVPAPAPAF
jgi:nuclear pore complex protein Nup98-Nup96